MCERKKIKEYIRENEILTHTTSTVYKVFKENKKNATQSSSSPPIISTRNKGVGASIRSYICRIKYLPSKQLVITTFPLEMPLPLHSQ